MAGGVSSAFIPVYQSEYHAVEKMFNFSKLQYLKDQLKIVFSAFDNDLKKVALRLNILAAFVWVGC